MPPTPFHPHPTGVTLRVKLSPGAGVDAVVGTVVEPPHDLCWLRISLREKPIEHKANRALVRFLAMHLHLPPKQISLLKGQESRYKVLQITGETASLLRHCMEKCAPSFGESER